MTDAVTISLIGAVASTLAAAFGLLNNFINRSNKKEIVETKNLVSNIERQTNGIKDDLVKIHGEAEFAKGLKQGIEEAGGIKNV